MKMFYAHVYVINPPLSTYSQAILTSSFAVDKNRLISVLFKVLAIDHQSDCRMTFSSSPSDTSTSWTSGHHYTLLPHSQAFATIQLCSTASDQTGPGKAWE